MILGIIIGVLGAGLFNADCYNDCMDRAQCGNKFGFEQIACTNWFAREYW